MMQTDDGRAALFIVSPRGDGMLVALAEADGWPVCSDGGGGDVAARVLASGAAVVAVDGRNDPCGALEEVKALGGLIGATGGALIVLIDTAALATLDDLYAAGATHFLASPRSDEEVRQMLRFAGRSAWRTGASWSAVADRRNAGRGAESRDLATARSWIADRIARAMPVGVLMIALSRLDILNAARGRAVGDAVIADAHARVEAITRDMACEATIVAAPGGGDITVAVVGDAPANAALAARLHAALAQPLVIGDHQAVLGSRWGLAQSIVGDDAAGLLRRAGEALIAAKASDGAMIRIAGPEGAAPLDALAVDLHLAIERDEIDILFQPQAPIGGRAVTGVEALARWNHGSLGPLGADALFAAADRADLGVALSDHIQRLVLARVASWPAALQGLRVSLNLTAGDLGRPGFAAVFLDRVAASGVPSERLTVEITETGAIHNLGAAAAVLGALRDAGCRVALDDFGTGYSSLAYLTALPLDYLKLDKALAVGIEGSPRQRDVVRAVMALARSLDLAVIAEGVETEAQRALLAGEGCAFYQGFLLAEAIDQHALCRLVSGA